VNVTIIMYDCFLFGYVFSFESSPIDKTRDKKHTYNSTWSK